MLLDLDIPDDYMQNDVVPAFVRFRVANNDLGKSTTYRQCQTRNFQEEQMRKTAKEDLLFPRNGVICKLKLVDLNHVCNLFSLGNEKDLQKH